jgi:glycerol-3-phosphate dehydrogenase
MWRLFYKLHRLRQFLNRKAAMPEIEMYEVLIVGGGKAGKTLAADLGRAGTRVALVER